ncbi:carbohydrate ABC transporter permease [Candidatus Binatia bacterium]|nr:carbohydrate ABC transporter permease [Candidatus Binatia bacterium]
MTRRLGLAVPILALLAVALVPPLLVLKQAFTPEQESVAWPPTWWPREPTVENFAALGASVELADGAWRSLRVALLTVVSTLLLALPAAWVAARRADAGRILDGATVFARVFPSIAVAVPLAALFVRIGLYNEPGGIGLWLAHTLLALPVAFLVLRSGFAQVPSDLEEAARLDGATGLEVFWYVSLPLVRPALGAAAMLVFLVSWDELATALLLQVTNRTLPPLLYYLTAFGYPGLASAVAAIMLVPAVLIVILLEPALRSGVLSGSGR